METGQEREALAQQSQNITRHHETIRREFAKQASGFGAPGITLSRQDYLQWMVNALPLQPHFRVLDVAAGTGHLSRAVAPRVRQVVALDATPEMLAEGRKEADLAGITNVTFEPGLAEALPYPEGSFDAVLCRLAVHHFPEPLIQVKEMVRVCQEGGIVAIIDLVSPPQTELVETYNAFERLRDPSHFHTLSPEGLETLCTQAGLCLRTAELREIEVMTENWMALTKTPTHVRAQITQALLDELGGGPQTGMRPFWRDQELMFLHTWKIVVGEKPR
jgi:ubiquinone/menaquinone biosynthesis C-methylase UbiE